MDKLRQALYLEITSDEYAEADVRAALYALIKQGVIAHYHILERKQVLEFD